MPKIFRSCASPSCLDGELVAVVGGGRHRLLSARRTDAHGAADAHRDLFARSTWCGSTESTARLAYRDRRRVLEMLELSGPAWCPRPGLVSPRHRIGSRHPLTT